MVLICLGITRPGRTGGIRVRHVISSQRRFRPWRATEGSVAVLVALMLVLLIGFAGLGTEVTYALLQHRQMQATASAAALGGATALMTGHPSDYTVEVYAEAAAAGFANGVSGVTVTVNHPPLSGNYTANSAAVEVIVGQPLTLPLSSLFHAGAWNVSARAVAIAGNSGGDCALELDSSSTTGVSVSGSAAVNLNCGLAVNANGSTALSISGTAVLDTSSVSVRGLVHHSCGSCGTINATNGIKTSQPAVANPYSAVAVPTGSGCNYGVLPSSPLTLAHSSGTQTLSPGVYCGGLDMTHDAVVVMTPGVYIVNGGSFSVGGAVVLTGTGVTIVLTGSGSNYATSTISNGATVTLSAPTTGATAGLLFFQNPNAPTTGSDSFEGGSTENLTGALYFPSQTVDYSNGTSTTSTCTQLIAWHLAFSGNASFNSNCASAGTKAIGSSPSVLVE
jgi:hypothetical protein